MQATDDADALERHLAARVASPVTRRGIRLALQAEGRLQRLVGGRWHRLTVELQRRGWRQSGTFWLPPGVSSGPQLRLRPPTKPTDRRRVRRERVGEPSFDDVERWIDDHEGCTAGDVAEAFRFRSPAAYFSWRRRIT